MSIRMTRLEMTTLIESRLGQRTGIRPRIEAEINAAQSFYESGRGGTVLPWFLRTKGTYPLTGPTLTIPTGFIRFPDDGEECVWLVDGTVYTPLSKVFYDQAIKNPELTSTGTPKYFSLEADVLEVFPQPDTTYAVQLLYYAEDSSLTADGSMNKWSTNLPEILIAKAGLEVARALRDQNAMAFFNPDVQRAAQLIHFANTARQMSGMQLEVGG